MSNILVGVTGGIACYKIPTLCRRLRDKGHDVKVIMTESASKFVTPLTFESVTHNMVYIDDFKENEEPDNIYHIDLVKWADVFVIAPATANTIAKIATGIADNLLTSAVLAKPAEKPLIIVPSMNSIMYESIQNKKNLYRLSNEYGYNIVDPVVGNLACQDVGVGKLPEPEFLADTVHEKIISAGDYKDINFLVTAGATKEFIDPVRYITNRSSGKMGLAFCDIIKRKSGTLKLICSDSIKTDYNAVFVCSAEELFEKVKAYVENTDILIMTAAVADYRAAKYSDNKIKKSDSNIFLELTKNPDILKELTSYKRKQQVFVGFAAESENLQKNAMKKLMEKKLDMIVANDISRRDIGFDSSENEVTVFFADGRVINIDKASKQKIAEIILEYAVEIYRNKKKIS